MLVGAQWKRLRGACHDSDSVRILCASPPKSCINVRNHAFFCCLLFHGETLTRSPYTFNRPSLTSPSMAKYLLIVAIVVSVATAGLGYMNHTTLVDTKTQLESTTTTLGNRTKELADEKKKRTEAEGTLKSAQDEQAATAQKLTDASSALSAANSKLDEATKTIAERDAKITELEAKIQPATENGNDGPDLSVMVQQQKQTIDEQSAQIASLSEQLTVTKTKVGTLEADKKAREASQMKKGLEGRVLAVNPAWNFVVLGIGDKQGVVSNAEMLLKRGDQYLGKVRVTSVEPSTSIADIIVNTLPTGVSVQPGDSVIFQGND